LTAAAAWLLFFAIDIPRLEGKAANLAARCAAWPAAVSCGTMPPHPHTGMEQAHDGNPDAGWLRHAVERRPQPLHLPTRWFCVYGDKMSSIPQATLQIEDRPFLRAWVRRRTSGWAPVR